MSSLFLHQVLAGLATGSIYACLALAIVMIYQTINHLNFAQGEMAMFSTYFAWKLMDLGEPYWFAFFVTIIVSFVGGMAIERKRSILLDDQEAHALVAVDLLQNAKDFRNHHRREAA